MEDEVNGKLEGHIPLEIQQQVLGDWDEEIEISCDAAMDPDFDQELAALPEEVLLNETEVPPDFDIQQTLKSFMYENPINTRQDRENTLIKAFLKEPKHVEEFIASEYAFLCFYYKSCISISAKKGVISQADLTNLFAKDKQHKESPYYIKSCLALAPEYQETSVLFSICYKLTKSLRTHLLSKKVESLPTASSTLSQRMSTTKEDAAKGKLRYIGGYVIAKLHYRYMQEIKASTFKVDAERVRRYEEGKLKNEIIDVLKVNEATLDRETNDRSSLLEIKRKQNITRGLTNITDLMFDFFEHLVATVLNLLTCRNYHLYGGEIHKFVLDAIERNSDLYNIFVKMALHKPRTSFLYDENNDDESVDVVQSSTKYNHVSAAQDIFRDVLSLTSRVLVKQFVKDVTNSLHVKKKMEHRKQVLVSSAKKSKTDAVTEKKTPAPVKSKKRRKTNVNSNDIEQTISVSPDPSEDETTSCSKCGSNSDSVGWICCDSCEKWYHRNCAGLRSSKKWEFYQNSNQQFQCSRCS